jgi:predicted nucleic acid-binding Zn ribbon protein
VRCDDVTEPIPRLRDLLGEAGSRLGIDRAVEAGALWARWEEVVGPTIAGHAEPTSLRRGVLKIRTESPAWATELGYLREQVMDAANDLLGSPVVHEVQVWTAPGAVRVRGPKRPLSPREEESGGRSRSTGAEAPEEAFERARAAWLRRRSKSRSRSQTTDPKKPENPW